MARTWQELFITGEPAAEATPEQSEQKRGGMFSRLRESMRKTRQALGAEIRSSLFEQIDAQTWERLEELLIFADVGVRTTARVVSQLEAEVDEGKYAGSEQIVQRLEDLLAETASVGDPTINLTKNPTVIMVAGVNGTGKTTSLGKIAWHLQKELGKTVVLGAADTYRAAAVEQLAQWADRAGCEIVKGAPGSDPGAVAYDAIAAATARGADIALIDTAGRLHTQDNLLEELKKIRRVIQKLIPDAPHETLLTIDATTGQNGLRQAKSFAEAVDITGIVLTKLDGTAKGGIALAIADELQIPVKMIGIGEALEDLRPFDAQDFARALLAE